MRRDPLLVFFLVLMMTVAGVAHASMVHFVGQGDSVTSLALEYYGDASKAPILRRANRWPQEGDVPLIVGEPVVIPECNRRVVREGQSWEDLAREELGTTARAWLIAEANSTNPYDPPEAGRIVSVPFLLPVQISEGLAQTVKAYYPELPRAKVRDTIGLIKRLNPDLPSGRAVRGARVLLPFFDLTIRPTKRIILDERRDQLRSPARQERQRLAAHDLEELSELLADGAYLELVVRASSIRGATELTEAQRVTVHRYVGQAFIALDREDLALREFGELLALQPDFQFDQVTTSPVVLEVLERARTGGLGE